MSEQLLTVSDVVHRLKIGRTSVYELVRVGHIQPVKIGRLTRFRECDVDAYVQSLTG